MFACLPKLPKKNKLACSNVKDIVQQVQQITETIVHDKMPLVSVIVPCYNVEEYIDQCLTSILDNGYQNIEVLVVDDRSTDSTVDHVKALMEKDNRIKLFHNPKDHNIYGGACRNIGLDHAKGKYVYFCDSDDYILPALFSTCVNIANLTNADIIQFQHYEFFQNGKICKCIKRHTDNIFLKSYPVVWTKLYNHNFLNSINAKFQEICNSNDNAFFIKTTAYATKIESINNYFYVYRKNTKTSVQKNLKLGKNLYDKYEAIVQSYQYVKAFNSNIVLQQFKDWIGNQLLFIQHINYDYGLIEQLETFIKDNNLGNGAIYMQLEKLKNKLSKECNSIQPNKYDVILSLTSYPHRFKHPSFIDVLKSLVNQYTAVKYKIVLSLFEKDIKQLPNNVNEFILANNIEVLPCKIDIRAHKKYYYVMGKYVGMPIITVDDDTIYEDNMVECLYSTYMQNPGYIVCGRCKKIERDSNGNYLKYGTWKSDLQPGFKDDDLFGVGVGGILYPPKYSQTIKTQCLKLVNLFWTNDDFALHFYSKLAGLKYMVVQTTNRYVTKGGCGYLGKQPAEYYNDSHALFKTNFEVLDEDNNTNNDLYMQYIDGCSTIDQVVEKANKTRRSPRLAIVCCAKNENYYINDWIKYHLNLGFDHIYIYDNNDSGNIKHYISKCYWKNITVFDIHGMLMPQKSIYTEWWKSDYRLLYDFVAVIDIDEFITMADGLKIKNVLSDPRYKVYSSIMLNWKIYGDGEKLYGDLSIPVYKRITSVAIKYQSTTNNYTRTYKSIYNCNANDISRLYAHYANSTKNSIQPNFTTNAVDDKIINGKPSTHRTKSVDYSVMYIRHYMTKTIAEYRVFKYHSTDSITMKDVYTDVYFRNLNNMTDEKKKILFDMPIDEVKKLLNISDDNKWIVAPKHKKAIMLFLSEKKNSKIDTVYMNVVFFINMIKQLQKLKNADVVVYCNDSIVDFIENCKIPLKLKIVKEQDETICSTAVMKRRIYSLVNKTMQQYDEVVWLDNDIIINNFTMFQNFIDEDIDDDVFIHGHIYKDDAMLGAMVKINIKLAKASQLSLMTINDALQIYKQKKQTHNDENILVNISKLLKLKYTSISKETFNMLVKHYNFTQELKYTKKQILMNIITQSDDVANWCKSVGIYNTYKQYVDGINEFKLKEINNGS